MMPVVVSVGILLVLALVAVLYAVSVYKTLASGRDRLKNAYAQIDVQLKRRYALIPPMVETARGRLPNDGDTLEAVVPASEAAASAGVFAAENPGDAAMMELNDAEFLLTGEFARFLDAVGRNRELMANQEMLRLMGKLAAANEKITFNRQAYNDAVLTYNRTRERFPANMIANFFNFAAAEPFAIEQPAENAAPVPAS